MVRVTVAVTVSVTLKVALPPVGVEEVEAIILGVGPPSPLSFTYGEIVFRAE